MTNTENLKSLFFELQRDFPIPNADIKLIIQRTAIKGTGTLPCKGQVLFFRKERKAIITIRLAGGLDSQRETLAHEYKHCLQIIKDDAPSGNDLDICVLEYEAITFAKQAMEVYY